MNWLKAIRIGAKVAHVLQREGVPLKGVPTKQIVDIVDEGLTTRSTVREVADRGVHPEVRLPHQR
jgi:hypothetical protein